MTLGRAKIPREKKSVVTRAWREGCMHWKSTENLKDRGKGPWDSISVGLQLSRHKLSGAKKGTFMSAVDLGDLDRAEFLDSNRNTALS